MAKTGRFAQIPTKIHIRQTTLCNPLAPSTPFYRPLSGYKRKNPRAAWVTLHNFSPGFPKIPRAVAISKHSSEKSYQRTPLHAQTARSTPPCCHLVESENLERST